MIYTSCIIFNIYIYIYFSYHFYHLYIYNIYIYIYIYKYICFTPPCDAVTNAVLCGLRCEVSGSLPPSGVLDLAQQEARRAREGASSAAVRLRSSATRPLRPTKLRRARSSRAEALSAASPQRQRSIQIRPQRATSALSARIVATWCLAPAVARTSSSACASFEASPQDPNTIPRTGSKCLSFALTGPTSSSADPQYVRSALLVLLAYSAGSLAARLATPAHQAASRRGYVDAPKCKVFSSNKKSRSGPTPSH